jgi:hypothetical protein
LRREKLAGVELILEILENASRLCPSGITLIDSVYVAICEVATGKRNRNEGVLQVMRDKKHKGIGSAIRSMISALIIALLVDQLYAQSIHQYYVAQSGSDSNPGTQAQPWQTINHAAKKVRPGDTVLVAPGAYSENILISQSGKPDARTRFVSTAKWGAEIIGVKHSFPTDPPLRRF